MWSVPCQCRRVKGPKGRRLRGQFFPIHHRGKLAWSFLESFSIVKTNLLFQSNRLVFIHPRMSGDVRQMPRSSDEQRTIPHKHYPGSSLYGSDYPGIATCQDAPYISYGCTPPPDRNGILRRVVVKACPAWQAPAQNSYVMKEHVPQ